MSTSLTIAVAHPNHLPCRVIVQERKIAEGKNEVWVDEVSEGRLLKVGEAMTIILWDGRRVIVEEIKEK
jgi:hypothetical protein